MHQDAILHTPSSASLLLGFYGGKGRFFLQIMYAHHALAPLTLLTRTESLDRRQLSCSCDLRQPHNMGQTFGTLKRPRKSAVPAL